jgi:adenine-specific DNA-methyltransferase
MDKMKLHSPDLVAQNIARLGELFPSCVTESRDEQGRVKRAIDFDQLRQELSDHVVEGPRERFHFDWPGKRDALLAANAPIAKTLRPSRADSVSFDNSQNLFIEGDNLEALKLLQESFLSRIKLIYIDPPYNTGSDFIYNDEFAESSDEYLLRSQQVDETGNRMVANTDSNGRYHSDWLTMMYSRLKLARNLLRDDGVILLSIDDHEATNLKSLCSEVFGQDNFIITLVWEKGRKNDSTFFSETVEYIHVFAKSKQVLSSLGKWREKKPSLDSILEHYSTLKDKHKNEHNAIEDAMRQFYDGLEPGDPAKKLRHFWRSDNRGLFFGADISSASTSIPDYEIIHPVTKRPCKKPSRGWGCNPDEMERRIADDRVLFGEDETTIPLKKSYLTEVDSIVKTPVFYKDGRAASLTLKQLVGAGVFENPKDHFVIADLIQYCAGSDAIVLDFFGGSGTTAHSVMYLNSQDGGKRRFIVVQVPEATFTIDDGKEVAKKESKRAFELGFRTIAEIAKHRIRKAGTGIKAETAITYPELDNGFRVLKVDSSNMKDVYYAPDGVKQGDLLDQIDNIREDRTPEDLLFQVLIDWGVDLSLPIAQESIEDKTVYVVDQNALAACFDRGITEAFVKQLAAKKPLRVVFRDAGFASDSVKINVEQIFKQLSPGTEVRSI